MNRFGIGVLAVLSMVIAACGGATTSPSPSATPSSGGEATTSPGPDGSPATGEPTATGEPIRVGIITSTLRLSAVATSDAIDALPDWLSGPLSEPLFVLGVLFILLVLFAPGGLSSLAVRLRRA